MVLPTTNQRRRSSLNLVPLEGVPFDLSHAERVAQKPPKAFEQPAATLSVALPRVGVLEPEGKHLWVIHKESNKLAQEAWCPIEVFQYSALG